MTIEDYFYQLMGSIKIPNSVQTDDKIRELRRKLINEDQFKIIFSMTEQGSKKNTLLLQAASHNPISLIVLLDLLYKQCDRLTIERALTTQNSIQEDFLTKLIETMDLYLLRDKQQYWSFFFDTINFTYTDSFKLCHQKFLERLLSHLNNEELTELREGFELFLNNLSVSELGKLLTAVDDENNNLLMFCEKHGFLSVLEVLANSAYRLDEAEIKSLFTTKRIESEDTLYPLVQEKNNFLLARSLLFAMSRVEYNVETYQQMGCSLGFTDILTKFAQESYNLIDLLTKLKKLPANEQLDILKTTVNVSFEAYEVESEEISLLELILLKAGNVLLPKYIDLLNHDPSNWNLVIDEMFRTQFKHLKTALALWYKSESSTTQYNTAVKHFYSGQYDSSMSNHGQSIDHVMLVLSQLANLMDDFSDLSDSDDEQLIGNLESLLSQLKNLIEDSSDEILLQDILEKQQVNLFKLFLPTVVPDTGINKLSAVKSLVLLIHDLLQTTENHLVERLDVATLRCPLMMYVTLHAPEFFAQLRDFFQAFPETMFDKNSTAPSDYFQSKIRLALMVNSSSFLLAALSSTICDLPQDKQNTLFQSISLNSLSWLDFCSEIIEIITQQDKIDCFKRLDLSILTDLFATQSSESKVNFIMKVFKEGSLPELQHGLKIMAALPLEVQAKIFKQYNNEEKNVLFIAIDRLLSLNFKHDWEQNKELLLELFKLIDDLPSADKLAIFNLRVKNKTITQYGIARLATFDEEIEITEISSDIRVQAALSKGCRTYEAIVEKKLTDIINQLQRQSTSEQFTAILLHLKTESKESLQKALILHELSSLLPPAGAHSISEFDNAIQFELANPGSDLSKAIGNQKGAIFSRRNMNLAKQKTATNNPNISSLFDMIKNQLALNSEQGRGLAQAILSDPGLNHKVTFENLLDELLKNAKAPNEDIMFLFYQCATAHFNQGLIIARQYDNHYLLALKDKIEKKINQFKLLSHPLSFRDVALKKLKTYGDTLTKGNVQQDSSSVIELYKAALKDSLFNQHKTVGGLFRSTTNATRLISKWIKELEKTTLTRNREMGSLGL